MTDHLSKNHMLALDLLEARGYEHRFPPIETIEAHNTTEVWLLDTGYFLVLERVAPAWLESPAWIRLMRQRRALRMFVPIEELGKLKQIETTFSVAKRGFEIRDALKRWRENPTPEQSHATMRTVAAHTGLFPPESQSGIRTLPFNPPKPCWDDHPKVVRGATNAGRTLKPGKLPDPDKRSNWNRTEVPDADLINPKPRS